MRKPLHELAAEYEAALDDSCGEWIEAVEQAHDSLESRSAQLALGIRCIDAEVYAIDTEIARLKARAASLDRRRDSICAYVAACMQRAGMSKLRTPLITAWLQQGPPSVAVNMTILPLKFIRVPELPPPAPDKIAIRNAIKAGAEIPGARLVPGEITLRIK